MLGRAVAVVAGVVGRDAVADLAEQAADRQPGGLAGDVPQAVVEVPEPARRLVDPARAQVEPLVELLAAERVHADHCRAQDLDHARGHLRARAGADALDPVVGPHAQEELVRLEAGLAARDPLVGVAQPARRAGRHDPRHPPGLAVLDDGDRDVGDLHRPTP